jgi:hypothetical protein
MLAEDLVRELKLYADVLAGEAETARKLAVSLPTSENRTAWEHNSRCLDEVAALRSAARVVERRSKLVRSKLGV